MLLIEYQICDGHNTDFLQLIELWETFLLQLDAEEDGQVPFSEPPAPATEAATTDNSGQVEGDGGARAVLATATDVALEQDA